ncbi:OmpA family protein [Cribrihabitans neustonicus]|uniref:OmpA family protein n=1 Tax=Cribrihabitans neustonicus TaxID=1429085 RepID=UPI003B5AF200
MPVTSRFAALVLAAALALPAAAAELALPANAVALAERETPLGIYRLPAGPEADGVVPERRFEGRILRRTWRLQSSATVLQVLAPLRTQLEAEGYDVLLDCAAPECGGFGFRFATEVVPAPDMIVDIFDYHFLSAVKGETAVSLLASRSGGSVYLQVIEAAPAGAGEKAGAALPVVQGPAGAAPVAAPEGGAGLEARLMQEGRAVLRDLRFASGTVELSEGAYESLAALARVLEQNPGSRILLVGHTDTVGALEPNRALSQERAAAVRDRLVAAHGADAARIEIAGAGYMAPVASNLTPEGRRLNRRVEAVLISE